MTQAKKFLGLGAIEVISHPYQDYISKSASPLKPVVKKLSAPLLKELIIAPVLNFLTEKGFLIVAPPSESMFQSFLNSVNSALDFNWLSWGNSAEKSASLLKTAESYAPIIGNRIANGLTNSYGHTKGKAEILVDILDHISETTGVPYPIVCAGAGVASYMLFSYCYDRTFGVHNQNNNTNQISIHNHVQPQGQGASAQAHQKPKPNGYFSRWC